jgi:phosphoribosylaminoimidazole-succinocarboxamide synthase
MVDFELIIRAILTGSGLNAYLKTGMVCGHVLEDGLHDGAMLSEPIFTPTTKAKIGHDEHVTAQSVIDLHGVAIQNFSLRIFRIISDLLKKQGLILADTKFEFGTANSKSYVIADEVVTPDSSRIYDEDEWLEAQQELKSPLGYDKQLIRQWGKQEKIHSYDPKSPVDCTFVGNIEVPQTVLDDAHKRYFELLVRMEPIFREFGNLEIWKMYKALMSHRMAN